MVIDYDSIADLYDLYVKADYDVAFFVAEAARTKGPVLELMAGTGRLSLPLIESGAKLTCVDGARGMLDVLSRKLAQRGLHAGLHHADVCRLQLAARFRLAILAFQSFMEIIGESDQRAALAAVFEALEAGGRFICSLHNPAVRRRQVDGVLRLVGRFAAPDGTLVVSGIEQGGDPVVERLQFFEFFGATGQMAWKRLLPMQFALIESEAFERMARSVGFRIAGLYGDYHRRAFDAANSPVMIWMLEKDD